MGAGTLNHELLDVMIEELRRRRLLHSCVWPVYWVTYIPPLKESPINHPEAQTKYFLGRKRMVAHIVRMKLKYPDLIIEKY